ncbi:sterol desaturase [Veronia nyctiphanis]|uniref:Sterol desaturase n=1 Tax=Veronia nyctiphanis TaxID=1278244 RepID=A0A4Q0YLW5_9GAMM|nr:sterol desaturase family protein [Veronia nyctiphanis]RXJ71780.1 sterol desaturase [Veronia nyctiphanis]
MTYQETLLFAIPVFVLLVGLEFFVGLYKRKNVYSNIPDAISSMSSGISNITFASLGVIFVFVPYEAMYQHLIIVDISDNPVLAWLAVVLIADFIGYWGHRLGHENNLFWRFHIIHHSSEEFNLACALRQNINTFVEITGLFFFPAAMLGVPPEMLVVMLAVHTFYQYWYHTQLVGDLGWLEYVLVTPQQHSIHHAMNKEYQNKNYGKWFSIFDQLFGTFQLKVKGVEPVYGVTQPVKTWNPVTINFVPLWEITRDLLFTRKIRDKFGVLLKGTNWRPEDVSTRFPINKLDDVSKLEKFAPKISTPLLVWSMMELILSLVLVFGLFFQLPQLSAFQTLMFGVFIIFDVAVYTIVMEGKGARLLPLLRFSAFLILTQYIGVTVFNNDALAFVDTLLAGIYLAGLWVGWSWNRSVNALAPTAS